MLRIQTDRIFGSDTGSKAIDAKFFEEQRQEMVAAIRAMAEHIAAELGKTALDSRIRLFVDYIARAFARFSPSAPKTPGAQSGSMVVEAG